MNNSPRLARSIPLLLVLITTLAYLPLYRNGFIGFDDHTYIYQNSFVKQGFSWEGIKFAFSLHNQTSYWHPLTWLSLMLDGQLWGINPTGYHLENLLFHLANGLLLFAILKKMTGKLYTSAAVAALFLLHPTAVESVAWGVERKTVLSTLLFLLAILAYLRYCELPKLSRYLLIMLCMALGLMAKSMIITLPLLLLLLDIWPLGRWNLRSDGGAPSSVIIIPLLLEKLPLMLLSVASVAISLASHSATNITDKTPLTGRISHALVSAVEHLGRIFWSNGHAVFNPLPKTEAFATVAAAVLLLVVLSLAALYSVRRWPWATTGWFWYLIAFTPISGLIRAGKWPGLADRFLYLPAIGILIALCFSMGELLEKKPRLKPVAALLLAALLIVAGVQTNQQVRKWHDSITLFNDTLRINPSDSFAHYLLGRALYQESKQYPAAEQQLLTALSLDPSEPYYAADLGELYLNKGEAHKALPYLVTAATVLFSDAEVQNSYASALLETGNTTEALRILDKVLQLKPNHQNARFNRGNALYKQGDFPAAREAFNQQLQRYPDHLDARINLGMTLIELRDYDAAIRETEQALTSSPNDSNALVNLGIARERKGEAAAARQAYRKALSLTPDMPEARQGLQRLGSAASR